MRISDWSSDVCSSDLVFPGIQFSYTQPAEDAVDEAETGLKSSLAVKVYGPDLHVLQAKGKAIKRAMEKVRGITDLTLVHELGQPNLANKIDRAKHAPHGLHVQDTHKPNKEKRS